jgi:hypothetical protein
MWDPFWKGTPFSARIAGPFIRRHLRWFPRVKAMRQDASCALKSWIDWMQPRLGALSSSTDRKMPNDPAVTQPRQRAADCSERGEAAGAVAEAGLNYLAVGLLSKRPRATTEWMAFF